MDVKYNPLKHIPDPSLQTYFMLVLFTFWSIFFGFIAANYLGLFGYNTVASIVIHAAILIPLAFTNAIFIDAERDGSKWLEEWKAEQSRYKLVVNRLKTKNLNDGGVSRVERGNGIWLWSGGVFFDGGGDVGADVGADESVDGVGGEGSDCSDDPWS